MDIWYTPYHLLSLELLKELYYFSLNVYTNGVMAWSNDSGDLVLVFFTECLILRAGGSGLGQFGL